VSDAVKHTQQMLQASLSQLPPLAKERVPGGIKAWDTLAPGIRSRIGAMAAEPPSHWHRYGKAFLTDLLMMVSLDCAAGASGDRCRLWFRCMADIASSAAPEGELVDPVDAAVYSSLARDFARDTTCWPRCIGTRQIADRVFYGLFTGQPLEPIKDQASVLFDNRHWLALYRAIKDRNVAAATAEFDSIAALWLSDYRHAGEPRFDLAAFPCFEPLPNAALGLVKFREGFPIELADRDHRLFFLAALLE
jgi:hypothetical protein